MFLDPKSLIPLLRDYLHADDRSPIVLYGPPACGKTALLRLVCSGQFLDGATNNSSVLEEHLAHPGVLPIEGIDKLPPIRQKPHTNLLLIGTAIYRDKAEAILRSLYCVSRFEEFPIRWVEVPRPDESAILSAHGYTADEIANAQGESLRHKIYDLEMKRNKKWRKPC